MDCLVLIMLNAFPWKCLLVSEFAITIDDDVQGSIYFSCCRLKSRRQHSRHVAGVVEVSSGEETEDVEVGEVVCIRL